MRRSEVPSLLPKFSHIYIEKDALELQRTKDVLAHFSKAEIVIIDSYKEILNRSKQVWSHQKLSSKLILAIKRDNFLYQGSAITPNFNFEHFYYNSLVLNCIYDCQYCYLQGMFPSAHMVAFMNLNNFFEATSHALKERSPLYLCISYDTDLLALEGLFSYCREWIEFARINPSIHIELRTKSVNTKPLEELKACKNVVIAWTLSPQFVNERYENKTPPLQSRIEAIKRCVNLGWKVRVCFDPVILIENWQEHYKATVELLAKQVLQDQISEFSIGSFRMNNQYFSRLHGKHESDLYYQNYDKSGGIVQYDKSEREKISIFMEATLKANFPDRPINFAL